MTGIQNYANLTNMLLSGYSQMNNVRLAQALSNKNTSGMKISQGISTNGKLSSADTEFLKDYQNELLELKDMAEKVMAGGEKSRLAAGAENLSVAEVSGKLASASDKYTLTVEQLASGQVNRSNGLESNSPRPAMSGSIKIETAQGKVELYMSAAGAKDNKEMLNNFASKINAKNIGVTAKVEEKEGKSYLRLEGASGEGNAFSVTGSLAERLGLDRVEQVGQNAIYTVKKNDGEEQRFVSDSNTVTLDGRLKASLKKTGTTNIKAGADAATGIADSVSKLVNKFNETLSFLNKNSDRGIGVLNQMRRETCSYEDFDKVDIRVGKVLECSKVKKSKKLLQFLIEDGMEKRTILSGIALSYEDPSVLVGKEICFIANFEPRKMMGIESQGMILSAVNSDGNLVVVGPTGPVAPGACVG